MTLIGSVLVAVGVCCALATVYPYTLYPALLGRLREVPVCSAPTSGDAGAQLAVLFCAFNEESIASAKVANLRALQARHPHLEILVYDDASTDRTAERFSALGPDVVHSGPGRTGKASGMQYLVSRTDRPLLLFTDANVLLDNEIVDRAVAYFRDDSIGGICGHLEYEADENTPTQAAGGAYWRLEEKIKRLESRSGNVMGGDGSIFVMRRALYPQVPATAQDDFTATMNVVTEGSRLIFANDVIARERLVAVSADEYRRKVRIAARAVHTHLSMKPSLQGMSRIDRWKYFSHKTLRWYGSFFILVGCASGLAGLALLDPATGGIAIGATVAVLAAVVFVPKLASIREALVAIFATGQGALLALRGQTFRTWTPPASR